MGNVEVVESAVTLLQLSNFASFFEASLGVNLAYGLIQQVHNAGLNYYQNISQKILDQWKSSYCEPENGQLNAGMTDEHDRVARDWYEKEDEYKHFSNRLVLISRWIAHITAAIMLYALAYVGLNPDAQISKTTACFFIPLSIAPTILFFVGLNFYWKYNLHRLNKASDIQVKIFEGAERIIKNGSKEE